MSKSGKVLVTGGAGFIGSHLVDALIADGNNVVVLDDFSVGLPENLTEAKQTGKVQIIKGSICDEQAVSKAIAGCDTVYHLAVQCVRRSLGMPRESHDVNATGTLIVLEAARTEKVERFIYCSSSEVYGNSSTGLLVEDSTLCQPVTVYGAAKYAGECYANAYLRTYNLPTIIVRPFNAYGPRAYTSGMRAEVLPRFVARVLNGQRPIIFGDGSNGRDFTYVTEIAQSLLSIGKGDNVIGETINIAYGRMVSVTELANLVLHTLKRNDLDIQYDDIRPGDVEQLHADIDKAKRIIGRRPMISIEEGVAKYIEWVKQQTSDYSSLLASPDRNWDQSIS